MAAEKYFDGFKEKHDYAELLKPRGRKHRISLPVALEHAKGSTRDYSNREKVVLTREDYLEVNILSNVDWEGSGFSFTETYGFAFFEDGSTIVYGSTGRKVEDNEVYVESFVSEITRKLELRTLDRLLENSDAAAGI